MTNIRAVLLAEVRRFIETRLCVSRYSAHCSHRFTSDRQREFKGREVLVTVDG